MLADNKRSAGVVVEGADWVDVEVWEGVFAGGEDGVE